MRPECRQSPFRGGTVRPGPRVRLIMKTLLIQASGYRENGRLDRRKSRWLLGMTLPYVAALTPRDIQVEIKDDMLEEITFREDCDLVGLTFMSHQAPRAFRTGRGFPPPGHPRGDGRFPRHPGPG